MFSLRLFHHPSLYKHFHKQHHEWTAPIGVVSIYAHPLEHMVSDPLPFQFWSVMLSGCQVGEYGDPAGVCLYSVSLLAKS